MMGEVHPARLRRHATEVRVGAREHPSQARVGGTLLGREVQVQRDDVEAGEEPAGEVGDGELEDGRSHELGESGRSAGVARGCRRETEASARHGHLEGLVARATAEVMHLVDDEEMEAIAELVHVPVDALEGGDRQRRQLPHAVAVAPDGAPIHTRDLP
jgi:hypothetical protein